MNDYRNIRTGFHPFWFWNDYLEDDEIRRQIREMADKGVRGFFIHPRQGLGQSYLSSAFFEKARVAIDEAKRLGLDVHLYDEFPYPSGTAGGLTVMGRPEFHATRLIQNQYDVCGGRIRIELPEGFVLEAKAFLIIDGKPDWDAGIDLIDSVGACLTRNTYIEGRSLSKYNNKRFWAGGPAPVIETELPQGEWRVLAGVQAEIRQFKYWGPKVDVYNKGAVRRFLELTHERYFREFGDEFGGIIRSIFVDETTPEGWSRLIPDAFFDEYGYELTEHLHVLQAADHPDHARVRAEFERLKYQLFVESWEKPYSEWCAEHGIAYSGEKEAVRFEQMKYMDIPGCDPGHIKAGDPPDVLGETPRRNARTTASAAYFYDKPGALCECFHSIGWSATLQDVKLISEVLMLCGLRYLVPHGFFYSAHGLRKHDAPPSVFTQMPYWPLFGRLSERIEKIAQKLDGTRIDADVLLIDQGEGIPKQYDLDANRRIHETLMAEHVEYLVCDTALLHGGQIRDGRIHIKDIAAKAVIVPPMQSPPPELEEWLIEFERAGGTVIRCEVDFDAVDLLRKLKAVVEPSLDLTCEEGSADRLWITRRDRGGDKLWFMVNTGGRPINAIIKSDADLREVALDETSAGALIKTSVGWARRIEPLESLILESVNEAAASEALPVINVRIGGEMPFRPLNRNLLRLYDWQMSLLDPKGNAMESAPVRAIPLANQLMETALRFAPEIRLTMSGETPLSLPLLRARYECSFNCDYEGEVLLVMERGGIVGDWRIIINGGEPFGEESFAPTDAHIDGSLAADITKLIIKGENSLAVEVETDRPDGGLINALYLAGDFGVRLDPPTLTEPLKQGIFEDHEGNLLPHFAGAIEYDIKFEMEDAPEGWESIIELVHNPPLFEACEVSINGGPFQTVAWSPRRFRAPSESIKRGENSMTMRVYTSLMRSFEGKYFDVVSRQFPAAGDKPAARSLKKGPPDE